MTDGDNPRNSDDPRKGRGSDKFLFPAVGIVVGILVFATLRGVWPETITKPLSDRSPNTPGIASTSPELSDLSPVQNLVVVPGGGAITVSWATPETAEPTSYIATAISEDEQLETRRCTTSGKSCVIDNLVNGVTYTIEVSAEGANGALSVPQRATATPYPGVLDSELSALWLDANDMATFGTANIAPGGAVSQWRDKSGRGYVAKQSTKSARPLLTVVGKRHALKFSGSQNLSFDSSQLPAGSNPSSIFIVVRLDNTDAAKTCFEHALAWGGDRKGAARMVHKGCLTSMAYAETFDTFQSMRPTKAWPVGLMTLLSVDMTNVGVSVRMNGNLSYTWTAPAETPINTLPGQKLMVGGASWWGKKAGWVGLICEIVVLSTNPDSPDRQVIEQYLTRKWSIS